MVSDYRSVSAWRHKPRYKSLLGAVHKVRHNIFCQFLPHPLSHFVTHPWTPRKYVTHLGTPILRRPSTKTGQNPLYKFCLNCSRGFLFGGFCQGVFVWKVLSGVVFPVLSEYICYIRKLNNSLNFMFRMYDNFFRSVTSHALYHLPLSQTVAPSRTPSPSSVTYFMDVPLDRVTNQGLIRKNPRFTGAHPMIPWSKSRAGKTRAVETHFKKPRFFKFKK